MSSHEPSKEEWRELAREASTEKDPEKMIDLAEQVVEHYDQEKQRKLRIA